MRTGAWIAALAVFASAAVVGAADDTGRPQTNVGPTIAGAPSAGLSSLIQRQGLLDPSKLTMWGSYSFGISSGPSGATSMGMLVEHMKYQLSKPLTLYMEVGLLHNPLAAVGMRNGPQQASLVIPALDLIYRPTDHTTISLHYSQMPSSAYRYGYGFGVPWWADPYETRW